jgi:hypothetical protein
MLQVPTAGMIAVLLYGSHRALGGGISIGEFAAFYTYVLLLVEPAGRIAYWMVVVQDAIAGAGGLDEILRHQREPERPQRLPPEAESVSMLHATVGYPNAGIALAGVDIEVKPRTALAVVRLIRRPGGDSVYATGPDLRFIVKEESLNFLGSNFLPEWPEPCGRSSLEASFAGCTLNLNHNCDGARYWLNGDLDRGVFAAQDFWGIVLYKVPVG